MKITNKTLLDMMYQICIHIADVAVWSWVLHIRLNDWCCGVSKVWVQIPSKESKTKMSTNSNTVG